MKILKIFALGYIVYVIFRVLFKLREEPASNVVSATGEAVVEPVGFVGGALTLAFQPSKWGQVASLTTEAAKNVTTDLDYDKARAVGADWVSGLFSLASEGRDNASISDDNARTLSEGQLNGTLDANPSSSKGMVYSGPLY